MLRLSVGGGVNGAKEASSGFLVIKQEKEEGKETFFSLTYAL